MSGSPLARPRAPALALAAWLAFAALGPAAAAAAAPAGGTALPHARARPSIDPVRALAVFLERPPRTRGGDDAEQLERLAELMAEVDALRRADPERAPACDRAALGVAAHGWLPRIERAALLERLAGAPAEETPVAQRISLAGIAALERRLDGAERDALAHFLTGVLASPDAHPIELRRAACDLLFGRRLESTQAALFAQARAEDALLREAAFLALSGWSDPAVHRLFADALCARRVADAIALEHLAGARAELPADAVAALAAACERGLASREWRDAVRATRIAAALPAERAAPLLIGALQLWCDRLARAARDAGAPRARGAVLEALERLSGRSIGPHPDRWRLWWQAVEEGRIEVAEQGGGPAVVTSAGFFGLQPETDRVAFVIDRSRSMRYGHHEGASRWEAAIDELERFARELGPEGRFNVTVFHTGAQSWRPKLARATPSEIEAVRRWLEQQEPDGATALKLGVRTALSVGVGDPIDPAGVEADTVIVLCDGETSEGPTWVRPWLLRANAEAELVFHCVQLGGRGDGTLERLAAESGGRFVRAP